MGRDQAAGKPTASDSQPETPANARPAAPAGARHLEQAGARHLEQAGARPETPVERTARLLRLQAAACRELGSALYAGLLEHAAADLRDGGPTAAVLDGHLLDPGRSALALRMLGGVHALVLTGQAPDLARYYPSAGGTADPGPGAGLAWPALREVLAGQRDAVRSWLARPPQTNEPGRGAALIGGLRYLTAAQRLPVRLAEVGASAGLNLRADHFRIAGVTGSYGNPASPVVLRDAWLGRPPPEAPVTVIDRTGGDTAPIDPGTADGRLALTAYVWPDQPGRLARLRGALALAAQIPADLRRESAAQTLQRLTAEPGCWTVLWHSVFRQYLDEDQAAQFASGVAALAAAATPAARVAHLSMEPRRRDEGGGFAVTLITWPGGTRRTLGTAAPHGIPVTWAPEPVPC